MVDFRSLGRVERAESGRVFVLRHHQLVEIVLAKVLLRGIGVKRPDRDDAALSHPELVNLLWNLAVISLPCLF